MESKKIIPLSIIGVAILAALFVYSNHNNSTSPTGSTLQQKLLAIENGIPTEAGKQNFIKQSSNLTKPVDPELVDLDSQIISCAPNVDGLLTQNPTTGGSCIAGPTVLKSTAGLYMGGQCCGTLMDTKEYHANLQKLQAYKGMPDIVLDPMHTPILLAKKWIDYDNATTLTPAQQAVYDQAYAMSTEKPCCCKCWHYYTNEGIAKKMIKDGTFDAQQIADYWDSSDICGA